MTMPELTSDRSTSGPKFAPDESYKTWQPVTLSHDYNEIDNSGQKSLIRLNNNEINDQKLIAIPYGIPALHKAVTIYGDIANSLRSSQDRREKSEYYNKQTNFNAEEKGAERQCSDQMSSPSTVFPLTCKRFECNVTSPCSNQRVFSTKNCINKKSDDFTEASDSHNRNSKFFASNDAAIPKKRITVQVVQGEESLPGRCVDSKIDGRGSEFLLEETRQSQKSLRRRNAALELHEPRRTASGLFYSAKSRRTSGVCARMSGYCVALYSLLIFTLLGLDNRIPGASATERPRYRTTYACEGSTLNMDCEAGHVINLIRANYGRFSITICNEHGNTEWSVNCMSRRSHRVLHDKCSQRQNCSVAASTRGFGDPCPGTLKYLEAQFQCVPVNLPHGRPRPSWLMEAQSTVSSITGDQPLQRPPQARDRGNDVGGFGPSSDADGFGGLPDTADADGILDSELLAPDGGGSSSSTSTTTTLKPPPWLKTNITKNSTTTSTTTTTSSTTSTTTTTSSPRPPAPNDTDSSPVDSTADDRGGSPSRGRDDSGAPAKIPVSLPDPQEDVEGDQNLGEDEVREREDLFEEQDRLLEKEMGHIFPQHYPHSPYGQDHVDENLLSPGWRPRESWCGPSSGRGLLWNWTRAGEKAIQACPGGASGWAWRDCYPGGWASRADLGECRSVWLSTLTARAQGTDSVLAVVHDLSAVTAVRALYGGDVTAAARLLSSLAKRMATSLSHFPDTSQREALLSELLSATLASASHLIGSQEDAWGDLQPDEHRAAVTALLLGLEQAAFLLADNLRQQKVVVDSYPNILMRLQVLETRNVAYPVTFPSMDEVWQVPTPQPGPPSPSNPSIPPLGEPAVSSVILNPSSSAPYEGSSSPNLGDRAIGPPSYDSISLPPEALLENSENRLIKMVFFSYRGLEKLLQPTYSYSHDPAFKLPNRTRLLNSRVLAASLGSGRHIELTEPVVVTFALLSTENVTNASCVFWDYTTNLWSEEGCRVMGSNTTHVTCQCDHLTNFAVLMDFHATPLSSEHTFALAVITYVGCVVSIVCLLLAIVVFHVFKGLQSDRTSIHKNLCGCLLVAEIIFLGGINQTGNRIACGVIAGLLHYFFLSAFAWMFMEGLQLYLMLVEVFEAERSRLKWYCLASYGAPAIVVLVSLGIDPLSYGTPQVCWLRTDNNFIFAFIGPVAVVLLANAVFLILSLVVLCRHASASASLKNKEHTKLASVRTWLRGAFVLVFLLGLTWTFGLLYLNQQTVVMAYVFTVLNALQGLFIFIFHCVQNDKKYSFKSCGRDSGHGGSEQDESPRTGTAGKLTSLRLNNNVAPHQPADRLVNSFSQPHTEMPSPEALLPDYRLANDGLRLPQHPGIRNQSPYNHTYTEISEGGKSISSRLPTDPVYEEIEREGRLVAELQVSDMSDEDGRRMSSDVSRQSSRSYGDHRPLLPYTLPDHLHASLQHIPHQHFHHIQHQLHQHQLHQNHIQQIHMQQQHQLQQQQIQQQLQQEQQLQQQLQQQQQQHHHHHHHRHHHPTPMIATAHPINAYETRTRPEILNVAESVAVSAALSPRSPHQCLETLSPMPSVVQPLSEPNLRNWEAVQHRRDMAQLQQHLGEMTVAVLNGEQVVCKLKSPLAPIQETTHQGSSPQTSLDNVHQTLNHLQAQQSSEEERQPTSQGCQPSPEEKPNHQHKHPVTSLTYSHC